MAVTEYSIGDWIVFNGSDWQHIDIENQDPIKISDVQDSINGNEIVFKGTWNALENDPYLSLERNFIGDFYVVTTAGAIDFNASDEFERTSTWMEGDWVFHDGSKWIKIENKDPIDVTVITSDILVSAEVSASDFPGLSFKGLWDASSNSPVITNSTGKLGSFYVVSNEGDYKILDKITPPKPKLPDLDDIPDPNTFDGEAVFLGALTLSEILPEFAESVVQLQDMIDEFAVPFVNNKKSILDAADRKVQSFQNLLEGTIGAAEQARGFLDTAQSILDEALNIANSVATALDTAGIYTYYYLGPVNNFTGKLHDVIFITEQEQQSGQEGFVNTAAPIAAFVTIAGADGGIVASSLRVQNLFNILGGNGASVAEQFKKLVPED